MSEEESGHGLRPWGSELSLSQMKGVDDQQGKDGSSARAWELVEAGPGS